MMPILSSIPAVSLWAERFKFGNRWQALTFTPQVFENGKSKLLFLGTLYWSSKGCSFKWEINFECKYSPHHFFNFHHSTYKLIDINLLFNSVVLLKVLLNSAVKKKICVLIHQFCAHSSGAETEELYHTTLIEAGESWCHPCNRHHRKGEQLSSSECRCQNLKPNNGSWNTEIFRMESNWDFQAGFPWFDEGRIIDSLGVAWECGKGQCHQIKEWIFGNWRRAGCSGWGHGGEYGTLFLPLQDL